MTVEKNATERKQPTSIELKGDREIIISRSFQAPARIVFEAWTKPEYVARWYFPRCQGHDAVKCEADVRVGGKYRYSMRMDGGELAFSGRYVEIAAPARLIYTQVYEAFPEHEMTITVTFEERGGFTHVVSREVYPSAEVRKAALDSGMEPGVYESMDQLDVLVQSLR